jgi:hypothetical protein
MTSPILVHCSSLTVLRSQMFSGTIPFKDIHDWAVMTKVQNGERPKKPEADDIGLDKSIWDLIQDCWSKNAEDRPKLQIVMDKLNDQFKYLPSSRSSSAEEEGKEVAEQEGQVTDMAGGREEVARLPTIATAECNDRKGAGTGGGNVEETETETEAKGAGCVAQEDANGRASVEADQRAKEDADRQARANADADQKARMEADRRAKETERQVRAEADRRAGEEADRRAREDKESRAKEEADEPARKSRAEQEADRPAVREEENRAGEEPPVDDRNFFRRYIFCCF